MAKNKQKEIRKLHRLLSWIMAPFLAYMLITGILLNHTDELRLNKLNIGFISKLYKLDNTNLFKGLLHNKTWIYKVNEDVFFNQQLMFSCLGSLVGVTSFNNDLLLACSEELLILDQAGQVIESITSIPADIAGIGTINKKIYVKTSEGLFNWNIDENTFDKYQSINEQLTIPENPQSTLPQEIIAYITSNHPHTFVSAEKFILDIHSGRLIGLLGVLLVDVLSLILLVLVITGLYMLSTSRAKQGKD